jgi:ribose transport system permease protein
MNTRGAFSFYKGLGFIIAVLVAGISAVLGSADGVPAQHIVFYTVAIFGVILWGWHHFSVHWIYRDDAIATSTTEADVEPVAAVEKADDDDEDKQSYFGSLISRYKGALIGIVAGIALFFAVGAAVEDFFQATNILAALIFVLLIVIGIVINKTVKNNKSAYLGLTVLIGLFIVGILVVEGFLSTLNLKSMLLFASFLGLACIGQTLVALLGGLDLSIPFVIGASNVGLMFLLNMGVPPWLAIIAVLLLGAAIGLINGLLSFKLQGQALILTLGVGFAVSGGIQTITTLGSGGTVFGVVPSWLINIASVNGSIAGISIPPVVVVWILVAIFMTVGLRNSNWGRNLYALGGGRTAAARLSISEHSYWVGVYCISGLVSALTGSLLLGWSGGAFIGVGDQYLFMTLAAVVVGGTSLLGGIGGYGFTVIGVLVLQVLSSFLVGIGLSFEGQQFVFGLLILPMVALYARSPHIRTQI